MTQQPSGQPVSPDDNERRERRMRRRSSGVFPGLILILLGVLLFLASQGILSWGSWWQYFLIGLGLIFLIDGVLRYQETSPGYFTGRIITSVVLIGIGLMFIFGFSSWWPLILIAAGVVVLLTALLRR